MSAEAHERRRVGTQPQRITHTHVAWQETAIKVKTGQGSMLKLRPADLVAEGCAIGQGNGVIVAILELWPALKVHTASSMTRQAWQGKAQPTLHCYSSPAPEGRGSIHIYIDAGSSSTTRFAVYAGFGPMIHGILKEFGDIIYGPLNSGPSLDTYYTKQEAH
ncbi:hypothetical protein BDZ91DRAFT_822207 [Kalaharituber pfeilii]|nr:hypothetical protein BDZ91DRAFT_822207 [Kalaharituber pfeilii]